MESWKAGWAHKSVEVDGVAQVPAGATIMPKAQARLASVPERGVLVADDEVDVLLWWVAGAIHALRGVVVCQSKRPAAEPRVPLLVQQQQQLVEFKILKKLGILPEKLSLNH